MLIAAAIDHNTIQTTCYVLGTIGGGITGIVAVWKFVIFLGKMLAKFESMDETLKKMSDFQESHTTLMMDTRGRVKSLEDWKDQILEDSRAGFDPFAKKKS